MAGSGSRSPRQVCLTLSSRWLISVTVGTRGAKPGAVEVPALTSAFLWRSRWTSADMFRPSNHHSWSAPPPKKKWTTLRSKKLKAVPLLCCQIFHPLCFNDGQDHKLPPFLFSSETRVLAVILLDPSSCLPSLHVCRQLVRKTHQGCMLISNSCYLQPHLPFPPLSLSPVSLSLAPQQYGCVCVSEPGHFVSCSLGRWAVLSSEPSSCPCLCYSKQKCAFVWYSLRVSAIAGLRPLGRPGSSIGCGNSSSQQDLGLHLGFLCQEPAASADSSPSLHLVLCPRYLVLKILLLSRTVGVDGIQSRPASGSLSKG